MCLLIAKRYIMSVDNMPAKALPLKKRTYENAMDEEGEVVSPSSPAASKRRKIASVTPDKSGTSDKRRSLSRSSYNAKLLLTAELASLAKFSGITDPAMAMKVFDASSARLELENEERARSLKEAVDEYKQRAVVLRQQRVTEQAGFDRLMARRRRSRIDYGLPAIRGPVQRGIRDSETQYAYVSEEEE